MARKGMSMRLLLQPKGSNLCGQTCVAMIAGISLEEAILAVGKRGLTTTKDIAQALRKLGFGCADRVTRYNGRLGSELCLCVVESKHWVVYKDGLFYDPAFGILFWMPRVTSYLNITQ